MNDLRTREYLYKERLKGGTKIKRGLFLNRRGGDRIRGKLFVLISFIIINNIRCLIN